MKPIIDQLWIADIQSVRERSTERFDRVVTVCQDDVADNVGCNYNFYNLSDGPGNIYGGDSSYELFRDAVERVVKAIHRGETVLVHCHMGQSRSAAVAIAAIAVTIGVGYEDAYQIVREEQDIDPNPMLEDYAARYIRESHQL